ADFLRNALEGIAEKMIRRHPHIFGDLKVETSEEVTANWQAIKAGEAMKKGKRQSVLGNLPRALPALQRAFRMGERASRVGFDWADASDVWAKVKEEERELRCALESGNTEEIVMEMGDLLFTLANMSRLLGINPEEVLQHTLNRFERRFHAMEDILGSEGHEISHCTAEEMNEVWERAKSES
ncbi:MAG TPA: MazG family protein, partial [Thermodesulfobacteriaceae bacterium]|nr:MazG family protein [Thermodesulfobacteriaceae bacterium]